MKAIIKLTVLALIMLKFGYTNLAQPETTEELPSRLVFYSDSSGSPNDLFYVDPRTLEMKPLIHFEVHQNPEQVVWSPDGQYIAIVQAITSEQSSITLYTYEGYKVKHIDLPLWKPDFYRFPIHWNSDGNISVLMRNDNNLPQLGSIDMLSNTLTTLQMLSLGTEELERIYWSPTGQFLAYQTSPKENSIPITDPKPLHLYLLNAKTGETKLFADHSYDNCVTWLNNSDLIGIASNLTRDQQSGTLRAEGLTILNTNGQVTDEMSPYHYESYEVFGCPFSWSHDDMYIAFSGQFTEDNSTKAGLFVARADSSDITVSIDTTYGILNIAWSPDDTNLAIDTLYSGFRDIRIISLNGWQRTYTIEGIPLFNSNWQPSAP